MNKTSLKKHRHPDEALGEHCYEMRQKKPANLHSEEPREAGEVGVR